MEIINARLFLKLRLLSMTLPLDPFNAKDDIEWLEALLVTMERIRQID